MKKFLAIILAILMVAATIPMSFAADETPPTREVDGKIYFGELTFFQDSGYGANCLPETQLHWGSLINLNMVEYKCENHPASKEE